MSPRDKATNIREVDPDSFGGQLRRFRMEAGLTQEELGEAIGLNQQRISMYERGIHLPEREEVIIDLANALGISPGTLFESSRFNGAIITSTERRERLKRLGESDWRIVDQTIAGIGEVTPEERDRLEEGLRDFFATWHNS